MVGACAASRCPSRDSPGSRSVSCGSAPGIGDGRETEKSDAAEAWVADLERLGARVVEASVPEASANTWPHFQHEALQSHAATFPSREDEYGDLMRKKLRAAQRATPEEIEAGYRAIVGWRRHEPEVDLYVSPCYCHRAA